MANISIGKELERLHKLYEKGVLTEDEFHQEKSKLLNQHNDTVVDDELFQKQTYNLFLSISRNRTTAFWLALLTGFIGGHKFYLGKPIQGILAIFLSLSGLSVIWSIIDVIRLIFMSDEKFLINYNLPRLAKVGVDISLIDKDSKLWGLLVRNRSQVGQKTIIGKLLMSVFIIFNVCMVVYLFSIYDRAGLIVGSGGDIPLLVRAYINAKVNDAIFTWVSGDIILGIFLFLTRQKN